MDRTPPEEPTVYCEMLTRDIPKSECEPDAGHKACKVCPNAEQEPKEKSDYRWDRIKRHLLYIEDGGHHNAYRAVMALGAGDMRNLFAGRITSGEEVKEAEVAIEEDLVDMTDLRERGFLEIQTINEYDDLLFCEDGSITTYSKLYRDRFLSGDEDAIFEYCGNYIHAFRAVWVVEQIEQWRSQETDESMGKLKRLLGTYSDTRGATRSSQLSDLLIEDSEICREIKLLRMGGVSVDRAAREAGSKWNKGHSTVKSIYYGYKSDDTTRQDLEWVRRELRNKSDGPERTKRLRRQEKRLSQQLSDP